MEEVGAMLLLLLLLLEFVTASHRIEHGYRATSGGLNLFKDDSSDRYDFRRDIEYANDLLFASRRVDHGYRASRDINLIFEDDATEGFDFDKDIEYDNELMMSFAASTVRLPIDTDEIKGLQYLYNATNGDYWNWSEDTYTYGIPWNFTDDLSLVNPCYDHWQGILCSCSMNKLVNDDYIASYYYDDVTSYPSTDSCHVTKIYLPGFNLSGILPGEMFVLLPNLTHLHVEGNSLYSPLPAEMNLSSLVLININGNQFEESLDVLGSITSLQVLIAYSNGFTGDLAPLQHLLSLTYLDLGSNSFTGTLRELHVAELKVLQDLSVLWLDSNYLSGSISDIGELAGLKRLYLYGNAFTGSIDAVGNLTSLQYLYLYDNGFSGSIDAVSNLVSLQYLYLYDNAYSGSIDAVSNLVNLQYLSLGSNAFSGSIDAVSNLVSLQYLYLYDNGFSGSIDAVSNLVSLQELSLSSNAFSGSVDAVSNLVNLNYLYMSDNNFNGSIDAIRRLTYLQRLDLLYNYLSGTIDAVSNLTSLIVLDLDDNNFSGSIDAVRSLTNLNYLYMGYNNFTGSIEAVSSILNLQRLDLLFNYLSGTIDAVSNLTSLQVLQLQSNELTGNIDAVSNLVNLNHLWLYSNHFTGNILAIRNLTDLYIFDADDNLLTGNIEVVREMTNLYCILLSDNQLTGSLDPVTKLTNLLILSVNSNHFTGSLVPVSNLNDLLQLDLNTNHFTGSLTPLNKLTNLQLLLLSLNHLTGSIKVVRNLTELIALYLSDNMFTGTLEPLSDHKLLQFCILDHNEFTGVIPSLQNASELTTFVVGHNLLTGALDPNGFPNSTQIIGVSNNMLSGELSMEFFQLPNLQILSAGINCLTAHFTELVCDASALQVLILDGIHSSSSCRETMPVRVFDTIYASYQSVSSIPSCLYSLPNMTNLHLSGNGITGSLPADAILNDGFVELIISNNEYRSVIPEAFQNHRWEVFDVSYNKFSGSLSPSLDISTSARLKINRISGVIPSSLYNTSDVAALTGNIFTCTNEQLLRLGDEVQDRYVCGSSSFTNAGLMWFTVVMVMVITIGLSYAYSGRVGDTPIERWIAKVLAQLHDIRLKFISSSDLSHAMALLSTELKLPADEIHQFHALVRAVTLVTGVVTAVFSCVHLPLYCIFSTYFGTYGVTYAWTGSAAYLSGAAPGAILFILYFGTLAVPCYLYYYKSHIHSVLFQHKGDNRAPTRMSVEMTGNGRGDSFVVHNPMASLPLADNASDNFSQEGIGRISTSSRQVQRRVSMISVMALSRKRSFKNVDSEMEDVMKKRFLSMALISTVNFAVVSTLNFAYVITILNYNGTIVTLVDIAMGMFKAVWTNIVIVAAIKWCDERCKTGQRLSFLSFTSIMNNIVIPCVALSLVSPDCFYNLLYSREDVSSTFATEFYFYALLNNANFHTRTSYESTLQYTPSYSYSYQCSSAILTSYVVIFLYSALFGLMSQPFIDRLNKNVDMVQGKLVTQASFITRNSSTRNSESTPSKTSQPDRASTVTTSSAAASEVVTVLDRIPINSTYFILHLVTMVAVMLSFGCMFPFLAFILFITIICQTKYMEYRIGQYIESVVQCPTLPLGAKRQRINKLNDELRDMQQKLLLSLWQIIPCLGPFYGIFVFDIIGDASSTKEAIFAPVMLFVVSVVIYIIPYATHDSTSDDENESSEVGRESIESGCRDKHIGDHYRDSSVVFKM